jgi:hypothetical protein
MPAKNGLGEFNMGLLHSYFHPLSFTHILYFIFFFVKRESSLQHRASACVSM